MRPFARLLTGGVLAVTGTLAATGAAHTAEPPSPVAPSAAPPSASGGTPSAQVELVPAEVAPGDHVDIATAVCGAGRKAAVDASAVGAGSFALTPARTPGADATGRFRVPPRAEPATYEIVVRCAGGRPRVTGDLVVSLTPHTPSERPTGAVRTGAGGSSSAGLVETAAGVVFLAVAAACGTWVRSRRPKGEGA